MASPRRVGWPSDAQFCVLIARTRRQGDRHILLALRLHDLDPENRRGATPGYRRLAALTGLDAGYVRNRLSALARAGAIHPDRTSGLLTSYFIVPPGPVTSSGDTATQPVISESDTAPRDIFPLLVTSRDDTQGDIVSPHVTDLSPPEVHSKGKNYTTASPKRPGRPAPNAPERLPQDWLGPFLDEWKGRLGGDLAPGRAAKALTPRIRELGLAETLARWRAYLDPPNPNDLQYRTPEGFSQKCSLWGRNGKQSPRAARALEVIEA